MYDLCVRGRSQSCNSGSNLRNQRRETELQNHWAGQTHYELNTLQVLRKNKERIKLQYIPWGRDQFCSVLVQYVALRNPIKGSITHATILQ